MHPINKRQLEKNIYIQLIKKEKENNLKSISILNEFKDTDCYAEKELLKKRVN